MDKTVLFRVEAGLTAGLGHMRRCLILANALRSEGYRSLFAISGDTPSAGAGAVAADAGFEALVVEPTPDAAYRLLGELESRPVVTVLDAVSVNRLADPEGLRRELSVYRELTGHAVLIDGSGELSLRHYGPLQDVDLIVAPYVGEDEVDHIGSIPACIGPHYYLLSPEYAGHRRKSIPALGRRVLITAGGSDPVDLSLWMLDVVEAVDDRRLDVRVVVGPYFRDSLRDGIKERLGKSRHHVELADRPPNLVDHMLWSDVTIANSGLTKYELAATGTPAILLSIDDSHAAVNRPFAQQGTALDRGYFRLVHPCTVASDLRRLLDDQAERKAMSVNGRRLIDGEGASRVAGAVRNLVVAAPASGGEE